MLPFLRRLVLLGALSAVSLSAAQAQKKLKYPKPQPDQIYDAVQKPAVPVGGLQAYAGYLAKNQQYPTKALQSGLEGTVNVTFVVEKSGVISNVAVLQPLSPALDAEAIRLIKGGPKWTPAEHRGGRVRQRVTVPISFLLPLGAGGPAPATAEEQTVPTSPGGPTVVKAEQPARPVGGTEAFFEWIQKNQRYPDLARQRKIEGRVPVEFMIQPDGSLTDVKLAGKRLGSGLDEEALRLIKAAPKWEPARFQGKPVKQKMVLPVIFQL
ncbi:protein TonB [Hymenobacter daecheongensis DSM 21074]|uniref:Protein TonB n=1 Tax=Hymenobacter daecheongensis DSM 21074 TaxID=1121955 RepID=A0A1M6D5F5_9BACT|nr:energy transducer TonB [Hymenobacter daecheongensis]SHI68430.1 protein TonB [Hymenobacter daecheongensis DSM 21074]